MGSGTLKAAAVNLLVITTTQWRDTVSKKTAATSRIEITSTSPVLMLALELAEESWKLGFSSAYGQPPVVRNIVAREKKALMAQIIGGRVNLSDRRGAAPGAATQTTLRP